MAEAANGIGPTPRTSPAPCRGERVPTKSKAHLWPTRNSQLFGPAQSSLTTPILFFSFKIRLTFWIRFGIGLCCARADSAVLGVLPGRPGAVCHQGPGQGRENRAREWRWPGLEMSRHGQTGPAEQVYLRAQGLNPTSSGSYLRSHVAACFDTASAVQYPRRSRNRP